MGLIAKVFVVFGSQQTDARLGQFQTTLMTPFSRSQLEPTSLQKFSPVLIDRACQLIGLLVNTSPDRGRGEIFVASGIDQVEMAISNLHDSLTFESYASFELFRSNGAGNATAVGQVFTFDEDQRLVAVFRGIRMRQMKQCVVEHLVRRTSVKSTSPELLTARDPAVTLLSAPAGEVGKPLNDQLRRNVSALFQATLGMNFIPEDRKVRCYRYLLILRADAIHFSLLN
jgi:hypothetical protein